MNIYRELVNRIKNAGGPDFTKLSDADIKNHLAGISSLSGVCISTCGVCNGAGVSIKIPSDSSCLMCEGSGVVYVKKDNQTAAGSKSE